MSCIAIIPARGGSKRIPKKNIRPFCGKPIIAYSIEAALKSDCFDEVMVSTDSDEIAAVALEYGAKVPFFRSKKNSDDFSTTDDVLVEVITEYLRNGQEFDTMVCIYPTAPFVTPDGIKLSIETLKKYNVTKVLPMVKFSYPPQRSYRVEKDGKAIFIEPKYITSRSQDLEPMYHDVGQYYAYDVKKFMEKDGLILDDIMAIVVDDYVSQDIDTETDWKLAEVKYRLLREEGTI